PCPPLNTLLFPSTPLFRSAVRVVAERIAITLQAAAVVDHRVDRRTALRPRIRLEARVAQRLERLPVRAKAELADGALCDDRRGEERKSTRLNSSHCPISDV